MKSVASRCVILYKGGTMGVAIRVTIVTMAKNQGIPRYMW